MGDKQSNGGGQGFLGIGLGALGGALSMIGQKKREERALNNQKGLMKDQFGYQSRLNEQAKNLSYQQWLDTNYSAQMEQMKKAGLNPALMYGQGGQGGQTSAGSGGGASGGQAPAPQPMEIGQMISAGKATAELALIRKQTEKVEEEREAQDIENEIVKDSTRDTRKARETNEYLESTGKYNAYRVDNDMFQKKAEAENQGIIDEANIIANDSSISDATKQSRIDIIIREAGLQELRKQAVEQDINLSKQQEKALWHSIRQKWVGQGLQGLGTIVGGALKGAKGVSKGASSRGGSSPLSDKAKRALMEYR